LASSKSRVRSKALLVSEVALFSALLIATRLFKLRLHVPGTGSITWIVVLLIARGISDYPTTATLVGLVSGTIITVTGIDIPPGPQQMLKYVLAGATIDALEYLVLKRSRNPLSYGATGGAASLAKLFTVYLIALVLNLPVFVTGAILAYATILNLLFGAIAGVIAFYIIKILVMRNGNEEYNSRG